MTPSTKPISSTNPLWLDRIYLLGFLLLAPWRVGAALQAAQSGLQSPLAVIYGFGALLALLGTVVAAYIYMLSKWY